MEITTFGYLAGPLVVLCVLASRKWALYICVVFAAVPQTVVLVVADNGIAGFYLCIPIVILKYMIARPGSSSSSREVLDQQKARRYLGVFLAYSTLITAVGPWLFRGVPVIAPRGGVAVQLETATALEYSVSNLAQVGYLALGVALVLTVTVERELISRSLTLLFFIGLVIAYIEYLTVLSGSVTLRELLSNAPTLHYQQGRRMRGQFAEPSVLGAFVTGALAFFVHRFSSTKYRTSSAVGGGLAIGAFILSSSGTVLAAGAVLAALAFVAYQKSTIKRRSFGNVGPAIFVGLTVIILIIAFWDSIRASTIELLLERIDGVSFANRSATDLESVRVGIDSWLFGVGLGSHRPSSLLAMLFACTGVFGLYFFSSAVLRAIQSAWRDPLRRSSAWSLLGVALALTVAKPDLATPVLWVCLMFCCSRGRAASDSGGPPLDDPDAGALQNEGVEITGNATTHLVRPVSKFGSAGDVHGLA